MYYGRCTIAPDTSFVCFDYVIVLLVLFNGFAICNYVFVESERMSIHNPTSTLIIIVIIMDGNAQQNAHQHAGYIAASNMQWIFFSQRLKFQTFDNNIGDGGKIKSLQNVVWRSIDDIIFNCQIEQIFRSLTFVIHSMFTVNAVASLRLTTSIAVNATNLNFKHFTYFTMHRRQTTHLQCHQC